MGEEFQQAGKYFLWNDNMSTRSESPGVVFRDVRRPCPDELLLDNSTFKMMGFEYWNQNHHLPSMLQEEMNWTSPPKSFSSEEDDSPNFNNNNNYSCNNFNLLQSLFESNQQQQQSQQQSGFNYDSNDSTPFYLSENIAPASLLFPQSQVFTREKPNCYASKTKREEVGDSTYIDQPLFKRPRIETPSPLPTFKVRKEKLGDRITALQQLVSPFGKTDTASVLHEAIEYIKFLHDQVSVLSSPYMKSGAPLQHQHQQVSSGKQDLKSLGLCVVPISSTFQLANDTTSDFWTPTFGATFR